MSQQLSFSALQHIIFSTSLITVRQLMFGCFCRKKSLDFHPRQECDEIHPLPHISVGYQESLIPLQPKTEFGLKYMYI